jgi:hypothetical protein
MHELYPGFCEDREEHKQTHTKMDGDTSP